MLCDARDRVSSKNVLLSLIEHLIDRATRAHVTT